MANSEDSKEIGACDGCGREIGLQLCEKYWSCAMCKKWKYCEYCRFCEKGHAMQKTAMLKTMHAGYANNSFVCNICKKSDKATDDGIWHCPNCNYDVCKICLE